MWGQYRGSMERKQQSGQCGMPKRPTLSRKYSFLFPWCWSKRNPESRESRLIFAEKGQTGQHAPTSVRWLSTPLAHESTCLRNSGMIRTSWTKLTELCRQCDIVLLSTSAAVFNHLSNLAWKYSGTNVYIQRNWVNIGNQKIELYLSLDRSDNAAVVL